MKLIRITKESGIPLIGTVFIGIVDRGSDLIQIRPTTLCNLKCIFCSTAANDPRIHPFNFEVEVNYLLEWIREVVKFKKKVSETIIDSVGEAMCYKDIIKLVEGIRKLKNVNKISMQSNGMLLDKTKIKQLEKAGLDRINLSVHSLDDKMNKFLTNNKNYSTKRVLENAKLINKSKIELLLAPVWVPGVNDKGIEGLIRLSKKLNCRIAIQKYEIHKYGRKVKGIRRITFWKFYRQLEDWEKKFNVKLKLGPCDFRIRRTKKIKRVFKKGDKIKVEVKMPGWIKNEVIGVSRNRAISIVNSDVKLGKQGKVRIISDKNELYIAKTI